MLKTTFFTDYFLWVAHSDNEEVMLRDVTKGDAIFVSGLLMDPEFIHKLTGRYVPFTAAVARNYARGERGRGKKKTLLLEPKPGGMVLGVLLVKLTQSDKDALDKFEKVAEGVRRKAPIRVTIGTLERTATTFLSKE
ncbi:gamma-glutamylcyclotransferase [Candidatus Poribacteria bacterium]|nr:gamma-glutamylcyclotransferase [Candidatus Poribacteria bacterium]